MLRLPSETTQNFFSIFFALLVVGLGAFIFQVFLELRGGSPNVTGAVKYLPELVRAKLERPYMFDSKGLGDYPVGTAWQKTSPKTQGIAKMQQRLRETMGNEEPQSIIVRQTDEDGTVAHHMVQPDEDHGGRPWDELESHEKESWKKMLQDSGHWTTD